MASYVMPYARRRAEVGGLWMRENVVPLSRAQTAEPTVIASIASRLA